MSIYLMVGLTAAGTALYAWVGYSVTLLMGKATGDMAPASALPSTVMFWPVIVIIAPFLMDEYKAENREAS
jgi:hypothetical protein